MIKAYLKTPYAEWLSEAAPGRDLIKTRVKSNSYYYYERVDITDRVDIASEVSCNLIDSLNNAYTTPNSQYQLPIIEDSGKITVYLPFFSNSQSVTIKDVILDVNATVTYDQATVTYLLENVEPVIGDIVFAPIEPTTAQGNNPTTNTGDINFDRGLCSLSTAPQYITATITPDYFAQRTRPQGYGFPTNAQAAFSTSTRWLIYANALSSYSLYKNTYIDYLYFAKYANNGVIFEEEQ